jgi:hypothetical protein
MNNVALVIPGLDRNQTHAYSHFFYGGIFQELAGVFRPLNG